MAHCCLSSTTERMETCLRRARKPETGTGPGIHFQCLDILKEHTPRHVFRAREKKTRERNTHMAPHHDWAVVCHKAPKARLRMDTDTWPQLRTSSKARRPRSIATPMQLQVPVHTPSEIAKRRTTLRPLAAARPTATESGNQPVSRLPQCEIQASQPQAPGWPPHYHADWGGTTATGYSFAASTSQAGGQATRSQQSGQTQGPANGPLAHTQNQGASNGYVHNGMPQMNVPRPSVARHHPLLAPPTIIPQEGDLFYRVLGGPTGLTHGMEIIAEPNLGLSFMTPAAAQLLGYCFTGEIREDAIVHVPPGILAGPFYTCRGPIMSRWYIEDVILQPHYPGREVQSFASIRIMDANWPGPSIIAGRDLLEHFQRELYSYPPDGQNNTDPTPPQRNNFMPGTSRTSI